jgi:uncharacterized protein (TIGR04255 family)
MGKTLTKLDQDTIVDVTFEVRFASNTEAVANILLGMLFNKFRSEFPNIEKTPIGGMGMPSQLIESDPRLRYVHYYKLLGDAYTLSVGEHVFSLACKRPYTGWSNYKPKIIEMLAFVNEAGVIDTIERFSLKYSNFVSIDNDMTLNKFLVEISAGEFDISNQPLTFHTELVVGDYTNIIDIKTGAVATLVGEGEFKGVAFDVDTIHKGGYANFWEEIDGLLEEAHSVAKNIFTGLLKPEAIEKLGPTWE